MGSALGAWHQHISAGCQPFTHGEARIPPSQLRAEQQEPGAGPEPPGSSSKARGAAPPGGHRDPPRPPSASGSLCPPPQGTGGPRELDPVALPSLSPLTNRAGGGTAASPRGLHCTWGCRGSARLRVRTPKPLCSGMLPAHSSRQHPSHGDPPFLPHGARPPRDPRRGPGATRGQHRPGAAAPGTAAAGRTAAAGGGLGGSRGGPAPPGCLQGVGVISRSVNHCPAAAGWASSCCEAAGML